MKKEKHAELKPKAYLVTKLYNEPDGLISIAIKDGYYKDLDKARGVIMEDFKIINRNCEYKIIDEIENEESIEIPVYDSKISGRYDHSYFITKVY